MLIERFGARMFIEITEKLERWMIINKSYCIYYSIY